MYMYVQFWKNRVSIFRQKCECVVVQSGNSGNVALKHVHFWPAVFRHSPPLAPCVDAAFRVPDLVSTITITRTLKQQGGAKEYDIYCLTSVPLWLLQHTRGFQLRRLRAKLIGGVNVEGSIKKGTYLNHPPLLHFSSYCISGQQRE